MTSFSVIIPTRDRADRVVAQVERVLAMDGAPEQLVVVDDGSTDGTAARLAALPTPPTVVAGAGEGPAAARNRGIAAATGDFVVFLDDDDHPSDEWMRRFRQLHDGHPDAAYLSVGHWKGDGRLAPVPARSPAFRSAGGAYSAGSFAVRRVWLDEVGGFDERLRFGEFTDLALRLFDLLADRGHRVVHDPEPAIRLAARPAGERTSLLPETYITSSLISLAKHEHRWRRDPVAHAYQLSALGVALERSGRAREGRRMLWRAARANPRALRHLGRALVASVPPLARRVWTEHDRGTAVRTPEI